MHAASDGALNDLAPIDKLTSCKRAFSVFIIKNTKDVLSYRTSAYESILIRGWIYTFVASSGTYLAYGAPPAIIVHHR